MPSREQVLALLNEGHSFQTAGRALHIPPGQAYLIATGVPADGSDAPHPEEERGKPLLPGSTQHLVNPPPFNPTGNPKVVAWVQGRAARERRHGA
jgi:hypothetical protein